MSKAILLKENGANKAVEATGYRRITANVGGKRKTKKADNIGVGVGIGIGVEKEIGMASGHEKLGQRGYAVCEEPGEYRTAEIDPDTDSDPDPERSSDRQPPTTGGRRRNTAPQCRRVCRAWHVTSGVQVNVCDEA